MLKTKTFALFFAILFLFTACSAKDVTFQDDALHSDSNASLLWDGEGGLYTLKKSDAPVNAVSADVFNGELYYMTLSAETELLFSLQKDTEEPFYTTPGNFIFDMAISADGIWIVDNTLKDDAKDNTLYLVSLDGEIINTITLSSICNIDAYIRTIFCDGDMLYVACDNQLIILRKTGELLSIIELPKSSPSVVLGSDGLLYMTEAAENGNDIYQIDVVSADITYYSTTDAGVLYTGDDQYLFTLEADEGLYGINGDGHSTALILWEECEISFGKLTDLIRFQKDCYVCLLEDGIYMLTPAGGLAPKTKLVIAAIEEVSALRASASKFNSTNSDFYVTILDYSDGGNYAKAQAVTKLSTEIISGNPPDMICFSSLSPDTYIAKDYLINMRTYFEKDTVIGLDDIVIISAYDTMDGIYYIANKFFIETFVGLYSTFGDNYGWTLSEYLDIEKSRPAESETLYNTTRQQFLYQISARYIRTAVDWENGNSDFESEEFIEILEASGRVKENPEDIDNLNYTYGSVRVAEGSLAASATWVDFVWKLAYEEAMAGCSLSFIGWPTVDGSCGSDIYLSQPIGIVSQGENQDGCWEFVKFMLTDIDLEALHGLPVHRPILDQVFENAKTDKRNPIQISQGDIDTFYDLLTTIENIAFYDETILSIILEESNSYFHGDKSVEDVARLIQSRVSIYLSEQ